MRTSRLQKRMWLCIVTALLINGGEWTWSADQSGTTTGEALYHAHCASCHGDSGRGDGLVGKALRTPLTDLTTLARKNGGVFPEAVVAEFIDGQRDVTAHGPRSMPVWGQRFENHDLIHSIVDYLRSVQQR